MLLSLPFQLDTSLSKGLILHSTGAIFIVPYFIPNLQMRFCPGKPFQLILMFSSKATAHPSEAAFKCQTRLDRFSRDNPSSLLEHSQVTKIIALLGQAPTLLVNIRLHWKVCQVKHSRLLGPLVIASLGLAPDLLTNILQGWKSLLWTNAVAYWSHLLVTKKTGSLGWALALLANITISQKGFSEKDTLVYWAHL